MKIAVCGKGGSGKSTVVALLANAAIGRGYRVLVVDSDESNSGLFRMLGFDGPPVPLMELVGGRKGLKERMSQPNILAESNIPIDHIPSPHLLRKNGLMLVSIGKIRQSLEGCACPMGVLSREFLKKLVPDANDLVIADMEAGVEHFGRGVETSVDSLLIVVEPSFESIEMAVSVDKLGRDMGIKNIWSVLNKVPALDIRSKLEDELGERHIKIIGCIYHDPEVFKSSLEGSATNGGRAEEEVKNVLDSLLVRVR